MERSQVVIGASLILLAGCSGPSTEVGGEAVEARPGDPPQAPPNGWNATCADGNTSAYGDGYCDCGCGTVDVDCNGGGCTSPSCTADACDYCWDGAGNWVNCDVDSAEAVGEPSAPAGWDATCTDGTTSAYRDGYCDCGCGIADVDCNGGGCTSPGCTADACDYCWDGAGNWVNCVEGSDEQSDSCADYDWERACLPCDGTPTLDDCCLDGWDTESAYDCGDAGDDGDPCWDYDWENRCLEWCDGVDHEGDGCCDYDPDRYDECY